MGVGVETEGVGWGERGGGVALHHKTKEGKRRSTRERMEDGNTRDKLNEEDGRDKEKEG